LNRRKIASRAAFCPHREHRIRDATARRHTAPHVLTISGPVLDLAAPQLPHSIFRLAPPRA